MKEKIIAIIRWRDADGCNALDAVLAAVAFIILFAVLMQAPTY